MTSNFKGKRHGHKKNIVTMKDWTPNPLNHKPNLYPLSYQGASINSENKLNQFYRHCAHHFSITETIALIQQSHSLFSSVGPVYWMANCKFLFLFYFLNTRYCWFSLPLELLFRTVTALWWLLEATKAKEMPVQFLFVYFYRVVEKNVQVFLKNSKPLNVWIMIKIVYFFFFFFVREAL